jgi:anti-sigma factor RsiW
MRRSKERVNAETKLLLRYLDGEMSADEVESFRARLAESPALRQKLHEMQRVGELLRLWAGAAEKRADRLVEPTLLRVQEAERTRSRQNTFGYALLTALLLALPWSRHTLPVAEQLEPRELTRPAGAAIERIEAGDKQAQVFVVGGSSTPVVWLSDDALDDDDSAEQDPG